MYRIFTLILFLLSGFLGNAQFIKMSTLGSSGGGMRVGGGYFSEIIGQSSVVSGTVSKNGVTIRQGFKQPNSIFYKINKTTRILDTGFEGPQIQFSVYPNPFLDQLTIKFSELSVLPTRLKLYDVDANIIWEKEYPEKINEIKLTEFKGIGAGKYLLQLFQKGNPKSFNLIKTVIGGEY
jgi:hypothetical protein